MHTASVSAITTQATVQQLFCPISCGARWLLYSASLQETTRHHSGQNGKQERIALGCGRRVCVLGIVGAMDRSNCSPFLEPPGRRAFKQEWFIVSQNLSVFCHTTGLQSPKYILIALKLVCAGILPARPNNTCLLSTPGSQKVLSTEITLHQPAH